MLGLWLFGDNCGARTTNGLLRSHLCFPASHEVHTEAPAWENFPEAQLEQVAEPVSQYWPALQSKQVSEEVADTVSLYLPAGQLQMEQSDECGGVIVDFYVVVMETLRPKLITILSPRT